MTIGFNAVADLAAGKVDAATAFWNAEGVQLKQMGIPTREFRVDQFAAPQYPELVVAISHRGCPVQGAFSDGLGGGYNVLADEPQAALNDLLGEVPGLDRTSQQDQLDALLRGHAFDRVGAIDRVSDSPPLNLGIKWLNWAIRNGIISPSARTRVADGFQAAGFCDQSN